MTSAIRLARYQLARLATAHRTLDNRRARPSTSSASASLRSGSVAKSRRRGNLLSPIEHTLSGGLQVKGVPIVIFRKEKRDRPAQFVGNALKPIRADAIDTSLVFLELLKADTRSLSERGLRKPCVLASELDPHAHQPGGCACDLGAI